MLALALTAAAVVLSAPATYGQTAPTTPTASLPQDLSGPSNPAQARELTRADVEAWLDGAVPLALEQGDIAGAVVVVVQDGQILTARGYGLSDVEHRTPMDAERTLVGVGSVSKTFAWTAVMQQVEQGRLDLDADINTYLDFEIPATFDQPITLRHLLTHTAGFEERGFKTVPEGETPRSLGPYLRENLVPTRIYPPGEVSAYSNYGAMLGGYIVERVSGEPFPDYVARHILQPLQMTRSSFMRPLPPQLRDSFSQSYEYASSDEPEGQDNEEPLGDPSGHLQTTATDVAHFMIAHLEQGRYGDVQLLRPETAALMHAPSLHPPPVVNGSALGFFIMNRNGRAVIGHPGDIDSFHSDMELLLDDGVGIFVSLNSDGASNGPVSAAHTMRFALVQNFMNRYFPAPLAVEEETLATAADHARLAEGEYWLTQRSVGDFMVGATLFAQYFALDMSVRANDDGTITTPSFLSFLSGRRQTWREVEPFVWREVGGRARLHMQVVDGEVRALSTSEVLSSIVLAKVAPSRTAALNVPLALAAIAVLFGTALTWPIAFFARRNYAVTRKLEGRDRLVDRFAKAAVLIAVVYVASWVLVLGGVSEVGFEPWIRAVQAVGLLCIVGAAIMVWSAWHRTTSPNYGWWSKAWSVVLVLAFAELLYFSFAFCLISAEINY
jgi:CubicO group peptidase (beta-lactamase class C family)